MLAEISVDEALLAGTTDTTVGNVKSGGSVVVNSKSAQ